MDILIVIGIAALLIIGGALLFFLIGKIIEIAYYNEWIKNAIAIICIICLALIFAYYIAIANNLIQVQY